MICDPRLLGQFHSHNLTKYLSGSLLQRVTPYRRRMRSLNECQRWKVSVVPTYVHIRLNCFPKLFVIFRITKFLLVLVRELV